MTFEREEHDNLLERQLAELATRQRAHFDRQVKAGAAMERMTGSAEWDFFLNQLEAIKSEAEEALRRADDVLLGLEVDPQELMKAKLARAGAMGMVAAIERAQRLPKQIMEEGAASKKALSA